MGQAEIRRRMDISEVYQKDLMIGSKKSHRRKKREQIKKRTLFVLVAMFNLTWYTIAVLVISWHDHLVPSELTIAWFAAWTVELALLAGLKIKDNNSDNNALL